MDFNQICQRRWRSELHTSQICSRPAVTHQAVNLRSLLRRLNGTRCPLKAPAPYNARYAVGCLSVVFSARYFKLKLQNVHHEFPQLKATSTNSFFCLADSSKHKDASSTVRRDQEQQSIPIFKNLEPKPTQTHKHHILKS